jgi:thiol-disulfide isomerase/thioredoxin
MIELPLTFKNGVGRFLKNLSFIGIQPLQSVEKDPWIKTYLKVTGIPENWTDIKQGLINTNIYQAVYQNYLAGNITKALYESVKQGWNWTPDTLNLSKSPMKCQIAVVFGKDTSGQIKMKVDANNNLDFRDDSIIIPLEYDMAPSFNLDSLVAKNSIEVCYERLSKSKIIQEKARLWIVHYADLNMYMFNFPQYAITQFEGIDISICSDDFTTLAFNKTKIILSNFLPDNGSVQNNAVISNNEYLTINGVKYQNKGVNLNKNVLILQKVIDTQEAAYSSQVGYKAFPIEGFDFKTKSKISLPKCKGKYVLIDFWAEWCGPCLKELPRLKALYDRLDKSKIEFIGVVGDSHAEVLDKLIKKHDITWPQILINPSDSIKDLYGIKSYPTTFLINQEGVIIAKNLNGEALETKIHELIR